MVHFIPTTEKTSAEGLARLFRDNVWKLHSLPESIISDWGPQFAAGLMRELNKMLGIVRVTTQRRSLLKLGKGPRSLVEIQVGYIYNTC